MKKKSCLNQESPLSRAVTHAVLIFASFLAFGPFVWMFLTSIKTYEETIRIPMKFLPEIPQWVNYSIVSNKLNFPRLYLNTILVTVLMIVGQILIVTICAYAFDRLNFPGKNVLFLCMLALMMVPGQIFIIPRFKMMVKLGLTNTMTGLVLPGLFNVFGVFSLTYLTNSCGLDKTVSLFVIVGAAAVMAVAIPFWGMRADTWGRARIFGIAAILLGITAYPTFWVLHNFSHNVLLVFLAISLPFGIIYGAAYATMSSLFSGSFEPTVRYSAVSFIYQFSGIFASGLTPMIATMLVSSNDGQPWYLCGYLLVAAVISSLSTIWITRLQGKEELPHEPETSAR